VDVFLAQMLQGLDVVVDVFVTGWKPDLDVVMNVDALDAQDGQAGGLHLFLQGMNPFPRPQRAGGKIVQRGDDPLHSGDLPNLLQGDGIELRTVPT
jgi:hypothetical protein